MGCVVLTQTHSGDFPRAVWCCRTDCSFGHRFVATIGLRPLVEKYATWTLGHRLALGTLDITWGNPLSVKITDLRLANAPWGGGPEMVRIESLSAKIDLRALLGGVLRFEELDVVKPEIVLERDSEGTGNWRFNGAASASPRNVVVIPNKRTRTPTFIDFHLHDGSVTYRTSSGAILRSDPARADDPLRRRGPAGESHAGWRI